MPRLSFTPQEHGFHFANRFTNHTGPFTTYGRCGGMVYAALDYYLTGTPVPSHVGADFGTNDEVPPDGNRLADYVYSRLLNSMLNFSAGRFLTWQAFWNSDSTCVGWSVHDEFNHLKDRIDHNQLTPLGLVAKSGGPGASHQVLAYGYDYDANGHPMVYLWDNNRPDVECVLKANQQLDAICEYNTATDPGLAAPFEQWKGFFVHDDYNLASPQHPPYQDIAMSQALALSGATVRPDPAFNAANPVSPSVLSDNGQPLAVHFAVKNYGNFPAHLHALDALVQGPHGEKLDAALHALNDDSTDLAPGQERAVDGYSEAFGTGTGVYTVSAAFRSAQNSWLTVPAVPQAPIANTVHLELDAVRVKGPAPTPPVWPFRPQTGSVKASVTGAPAQPAVTDLTDAKQPAPTH